MKRTVRSSLRAALAAACASAALLAASAVPAGAAPPAGPSARPGVEVEIPGPEHGGEAGSGRTRVPAAGRAKAAPRLSGSARAADGQVTRTAGNGPTADRLDVVFVGDGYTAAELDRYHADVRAKWAEVTAVEQRPSRTWPRPTGASPRSAGTSTAASSSGSRAGPRYGWRSCGCWTCAPTGSR